MQKISLLFFDQQNQLAINDDIWFAIAQIEQQLFEDAWNKQSLLDSLNQFGTKMLIAFDDNYVIGYCIFNSVFEIAEILRIAVSQKHQKMGVGEQLLIKSCQIAKDNQAEKMLLEVRMDNLPAINLYKKLKFYQIDIRKNYYQFSHQKLDALIFEKNLLA